MHAIEKNFEMQDIFFTKSLTIARNLYETNKLEEDRLKLGRRLYNYGFAAYSQYFYQLSENENSKNLIKFS